MPSLRILTIASFLDKEDKIVDIGCDHGYLAIYAMQQKLVASVIATDIHENALNAAKKNIYDAHLESRIPIILSDGVQNILDRDFDTLVIAGMGTSTILHILEDVSKNKVKKLILQSNNDLYLLRSSLEKKGYFLKEEKVVYERSHYYVVGVYVLKGKPLSYSEKLYGKYDEENSFYYQYLYEKLVFVYKKIRMKNLFEKFKIGYQILLLKKYL